MFVSALSLAIAVLAADFCHGRVATVVERILHSIWFRASSSTMRTSISSTAAPPSAAHNNSILVPFNTLSRCYSYESGCCPQSAFDRSASRSFEDISEASPEQVQGCVGGTMRCNSFNRSWMLQLAQDDLGHEGSSTRESHKVSGFPSIQVHARLKPSLSCLGSTPSRRGRWMLCSSAATRSLRNSTRSIFLLLSLVRHAPHGGLRKLPAGAIAALTSTLTEWLSPPPLRQQRTEQSPGQGSLPPLRPLFRHFYRCLQL